MASPRRSYRVAEKIREILSIHLREVADPRLGFVTITSVALSSDLREAKVYWNVTGGKDCVAETERAFKKAGGHFRSILGKQLGTRYVPQLRFYYDDTLDTQEEINQLMSRIEHD